MNILYLGPNSGTSRQRKEALLRLGHQVTHIDPYALLPANRFISLWQWKTGSLGLAEIVRRRVLQSLEEMTFNRTTSGRAAFDLAWVDQGNLISPGLVRELKSTHCRGALLHH